MTTYLFILTSHECEIFEGRQYFLPAYLVNLFEKSKENEKRISLGLGNVVLKESQFDFIRRLKLNYTGEPL